MGIIDKQGLCYAMKSLSSSYPALYYRLYYNFATLPASGNDYILNSLVNAVSSRAWQIRLRNDSGAYKISIFEPVTSTVYGETAITITTGVWYCFEQRVTVDASDGIMQLWQDGVNLIDLSGENTGSSNIAYAFAGYRTDYSSNATLYIDCVVVADAYIGPEATLQTVTDSLSFSDAVLRHKTLSLSDSLGLDDTLHGDKTLLLGDSASLLELVTVIFGEVMKYLTATVTVADVSKVLKTLKIPDTLMLVDSASTPSRVLHALDTVDLTDSSLVNKTLQINDTISLAEVVEVGAGGVKKTKLFLIIGDLAVQLTGD
jgi:hypothetical protein